MNLQADEVGNKIMGDLHLSDDQVEYFYTNDTKRRFSLSDPTRHWPNGIVIYEFDDNVGENLKDYVIQAMLMIEKHSCIRFKGREGEQGFINIEYRDECGSEVQTIS